MSACDAHIHLFAEGYAGRSGASPAGGDEVAAYEELRAQHDIDAALVVGYTAEARYRGNNAFVLERAAHHPWMRPLAYVDAGAGPAEAQAALTAGYYGLSVYATGELDPRDTARLLARIAPPLIERRALLSLNVVPRNYPAVLDVSERFPELRMLLSHLGLPAAGAGTPSDVAAALSWLPRLAAGPNTRVKASGGYALGDTIAAAEAVAVIVAAFGTDRVLWGSDFPVVLDHETFAEALGGSWLDGVPPSARTAVLGDNLRRLLAEVELNDLPGSVGGQCT